MIDPAAMQLIQPALAPGERVLWAGRPGPGFYLRLPDFAHALNGGLLVAFGALWITFTGSMPVVAGDGPDIVFTWFPLVGWVLVAAGVCGLAIRPFVQRFLRSHTAYAVTGERLVAVTAFAGAQVRSHALTDAPDPVLTLHGDGRGTVAIQWTVPGRKGQRRREFAFVGIAQPQLAEQAIRHARTALAAGRAQPPSD